MLWILEADRVEAEGGKEFERVVFVFGIHDEKPSFLEIGSCWSEVFTPQFEARNREAHRDACSRGRFSLDLHLDDSSWQTDSIEIDARGWSKRRQVLVKQRWNNHDSDATSLSKFMYLISIFKDSSLLQRKHALCNVGNEL